MAARIIRSSCATTSGGCSSARAPMACSFTTAPRSRRFPPRSTASSSAASLYRGVELPDATFAIATTGAGLVIIDSAGPARCRARPGTMACAQQRGVQRHGRPRRRRSGRRWSAGLARIETPSPASFFDATDGFAGRVQPSPARWPALSGVRRRREVPASGGPGRPATPSAACRASATSAGGSRTWTTPPAGGLRLWPVACTDGLYEIQRRRRHGRSARRLTAPTEAAALLAVVGRPDQALGRPCSTVWPRSAGWTAGGSTRAASRASRTRSGLCLEGQTDRCGPAPAPAACVHISLRDDSPNLAGRARPAGDR